MSEREILMRRLSAAQFAARELRIYLGTHPGDNNAMISMNKYNAAAAALAHEYEAKYGPIEADWPAKPDIKPWQIT